MPIQMCPVNSFIPCYAYFFSVSDNCENDSFPTIIFIHNAAFNKNSHFPVSFKISVLEGIPIGCKDQLPAITDWGYSYQAHMGLALTFRCQNSEVAGFKEGLNILLDCDLPIHICKRVLSRYS